MRPRRGEIVLPGSFTARSGLYVPMSFQMPIADRIPPGLVPQPDLFLVGRMPSVMDQVFAYATQEELGLEVIDTETIVAILRELPFWPAMHVLSRYQRDLWPVRSDQDGQRQLLHRWYGEDTPFVVHAEAFLRGSSSRMVFSEQQLFALQKFVLLCSPEGEVEEELSSTQYLGLMMALAASSTWQERELASWYLAEGQKFGTERSPFVEQFFDAAMTAVLKTVFTDEQRREYETRAGARTTSAQTRE